MKGQSICLNVYGISVNVISVNHIYRFILLSYQTLEVIDD